MFASLARYVAAVAALTCCSLSAFAATEVLVGDAKSQPESMAVGPGGVLYVGSASSPFIYRVQPGATTAEKFIDLSSEPAVNYFLGVLTDPATNTLWACQQTPVPDTKPVQRHTALRAFDLKTGAPKLRWNLPGENTTCNDMVVGPDKALYISDTGPGRIYRLALGAQSAELFSDARQLGGIDGITFLDGVLYTNSVVFNKLYRIPVTAGKAGAPEDIWMDAPVRGIDGMRAANGKLFAAENGSGKITQLELNGDRAHVTVLKEGLKTPTGVEPAGDTLWFTERGTGKVMSMPLPK